MNRPTPPFPGPSFEASTPEPLFRIPPDAKAILTFPVRSLKRHRLLALQIAGGIVGAAVLAVIVLPKHYVVETKMIAEKNLVLPALGNPRRPSNLENDAPTRLAAEAVLRRDNLEHIIDAANMMSTWEEARPALGKIKDWLDKRSGHVMSEKDRRLAMVGILAQRIWVRTEDGTISIGVDWSDPKTALKVVETAQANFIEQRQQTEIAMIEESINILNQHSTTAEASMQAALERLRGSAARANLPGLRDTVGVHAATELATVQASLADKQRAIASVESNRTTRRLQLTARLAELQRNYGPAHPEVEATMTTMRDLLADTTELQTLHEEEAVLRARAIRLGGGDMRLASPGISSMGRRDTIANPDVVYAMSRLKMATTEYEDLLDRLQSARIELQIARAAFKYRFTIVIPAELPKKVTKPKVPLLIAGGVFLAIVFGIGAAVAMDFATGRVLEEWQVQRQLGLPVLASLGRTE